METRSHHGNLCFFIPCFWSIDSIVRSILIELFFFFLRWSTPENSIAQLLTIMLCIIVKLLDLPLSFGELRDIENLANLESWVYWFFFLATIGSMKQFWTVIELVIWPYIGKIECNKFGIPLGPIHWMMLALLKVSNASVYLYS